MAEGYRGTESAAFFAAAIEPSVVDVPFGTIDGDYMTAVVYRTGTATAPDTPAGWTHVLDASLGAGETIHVYEKIRAGDTTVTWTVPGSPGGNEKFFVFISSYYGSATGTWTAGQTATALGSGSPPGGLHGIVSGTLPGEANGTSERLTYEIWLGYGDIYNNDLNTPGSGFPANSYPDGWDLMAEETDPDLPRSLAVSLSCYTMGLVQKVTSAAYGDDDGATDTNFERGSGPRISSLRLLGPSWAGIPVIPGDPGPTGGGFFALTRTLSDSGGSQSGGGNVPVDFTRRKIKVRVLPGQVSGRMSPPRAAKASQANFDHVMGLIQQVSKMHNGLVDDISTLQDRVAELENDQP